MFCFNMRSTRKKLINCPCGVMVSVLASSVVDRGFELRAGQIKDYKTGICINPLST